MIMIIIFFSFIAIVEAILYLSSCALVLLFLFLQFPLTNCLILYGLPPLQQHPEEEKTCKMILLVTISIRAESTPPLLLLLLLLLLMAIMRLAMSIVWLLLAVRETK